MFGNCKKMFGKVLILLLVMVLVFVAATLLPRTGKRNSKPMNKTRTVETFNSPKREVIMYYSYCNVLSEEFMGIWKKASELLGSIANFTLVRVSTAEGRISARRAGITQIPTVLINGQKYDIQYRLQPFVNAIIFASPYQDTSSRLWFHALGQNEVKFSVRVENGEIDWNTAPENVKRILDLDVVSSFDRTIEGVTYSLIVSEKFRGANKLLQYDSRFKSSQAPYMAGDMSTILSKAELAKPNDIKFSMFIRTTTKLVWIKSTEEFVDTALPRFG